MDKNFSQKDQKAMLNALEKAKKMRHRMEEKADEKRWAEIDLPLTLSTGLARLTKTDLSAIRSNLKIKGASALNKQDLIRVLEREIPAAVSNLLNLWDESRFNIMKQVADRGGQAYVPLEDHQIDYFSSRGLLFSGTCKGKRTLAMPQEVLAVYKGLNLSSYRDKIQRNTAWIKLTQGMLFYYGTLDLNGLEPLIEIHTGMKPSLPDYLFVMQDSESYYRAVRSDSQGLSNIRVWDAERVVKEHQARPELSFYPFAKSQLLQAGEPGFADRNASFRSLADFIFKNYMLTREKAESLVEECVYAIRNGESTDHLLQFLQMHLKLESPELIRSCVDHLVYLQNHTRQWFLKGYTPNELSQDKGEAAAGSSALKGEIIDFATGKKVGRNDPCPCQSGKKFKKCCGNKL